MHRVHLRWLRLGLSHRSLRLNNNFLSGDVPPLPPSVNGSFDDNCLANCTFVRQASCPCGAVSAAVAAALVDVWTATNGMGWRNRGNWASSSDPVRGGAMAAFVRMNLT